MKKLILLTSQYPYLFAETFLENEMPYLGEAFNTIYIFSTNARKDDVVTRRVPPNVRVFPLGNETSIVKYFKYALNGITGKNKFFKIREKKIKRVAASIYIRGRAKSIATSIFKAIMFEDLNVQDVTIYSFWFAYQAVASVMLAEMLIAKGNNVTVVSRAHGYDLYWERVSGRYLPFQDVLLKKMKYCFPCSEHGKEYILKRCPWAKNKVITARLGTKDYGINPYTGEKVIVTCCNLEPLKRMRLFAEAFCRIARVFSDVKWICIGEGVEKDIIRKIVADNGIEKQVEIQGRIKNEDIMEIYKRRGIMYFCNVSTTEGVPVSIMEAQSFGIPVIATDAGGTRELVNDINGKLLPVEIDAEYLSIVLKHMISLPNNIYENKRNISRKTWEEKSSAEINYRNFLSMIV